MGCGGSKSATKSDKKERQVQRPAEKGEATAEDKASVASAATSHSNKATESSHSKAAAAAAAAATTCAADEHDAKPNIEDTEPVATPHSAKNAADEAEEGVAEKKSDHEAGHAAGTRSGKDEVDPEPCATATDDAGQIEAAETPAAAGKSDEAVNPVIAATLRKEGVSKTQKDSQVQAGDEGYLGPGPAAEFDVEDVFGCFDEGNGLLFRLVNDRRHMWAYYNDTSDYVMCVSVVFGNESMVRAMGSATLEVLNAETGQCRVEVEVKPGETQSFMRGEYNGFTTTYDAIPTYMIEDEEVAAGEGQAEVEEAAEVEAERTKDAEKEQEEAA